ncbi:DUF58 domain-containing protein [Kytococcus schroeteri]|uniref:DUF58 domain-containing protein n=1 Tax=Kytococcus schroeteri TaxID=138300 RepID=A0A2I1PA80_9MICO|nr:DUF58 domain-containing protein [Kytococcus schroeteri]PKZ41539.1 hypothetical protein CYJ76_07455 [Kytococcus schroeteri]
MASVSSRRLPGFTLRGWVLVFSGLVLVGTGQYFALGDLSRLGVLLVVLPLLTWLLGLGAARTTHSDLSTEPAAPRAGDAVQVQVATRSTSPLPSPPVVAHLPLHPTWGEPVELGTMVVGPRATQRTVDLRAGARGRFELGPVLLDRSDPFGLTRQALTRSGEALAVDVLPRAVDYPATRVRRLVQDAAQRTLSARPTSDSLDATAVREYGRGDDVRRVHWRSTARAGELMVRHDDTELVPWVLVVLDEAAAWGEPASDGGDCPGPAAFEGAVRVAATLVEATARAGLRVRLLTASGWQERLHERDLTRAEALAHLARVAPRGSRPAGFTEAALTAPRRGGVPFLLTVGDTTTALGDLAARHPRHTGSALLVTDAPSGRETAVFGLRRAGWRVATWGPAPAAAAGGTPPGAEAARAADAQVRRAVDLLTRTTSRGETR